MLAMEMEAALNRGEQGIMGRLTRDFERTLITKALEHTAGRRIEAAQRLGIGRNTLTRKIQELGMDKDKPG
jgi:two-component system nitrogen regulation response regulator GlnG